MSTKKTALSHLIAIVFLLSFAANASTSLPIKSNNGKNTHFTFQHNTVLKTLTLKTFNSNYTVEIYDMTGKSIHTYNLDKNTSMNISTANIKPGTYYLRYVGNSRKSYNSVEKLILK